MKKLVSSMLLVGLLAGSVPAASSFAMDPEDVPIVVGRGSRWKSSPAKVQMAKLTKAKEEIVNLIKEYKETYLPADGCCDYDKEPNKAIFDHIINEVELDVLKFYNNAMKELKMGIALEESVFEKIIKEWNDSIKMIKEYVLEKFKDKILENIAARDEKRDLKNSKTKHDSENLYTKDDSEVSPEEKKKARANLIQKALVPLTWEDLKIDYYPCSFQREDLLEEFLKNMEMEEIKQLQEEEKSNGDIWEKEKYSCHRHMLQDFEWKLNDIIDYLIKFEDSRAIPLLERARKLRANINFSLKKFYEIGRCNDIEEDKVKEYNEIFNGIVNDVKKHI